LRFSAAFYLLLAHASRTDFSTLPALIGHEAVIVFFVLSGYVIALTTERKDKTLRQYTIARLSRLYSVVIPSLVLTYTADCIGVAFNPHVYAGVPEDQIATRLLAAITYTSQIWFLDISIFSNTPYWSLPYEFWFYVLWGLYFYLDHVIRNILLSVVVLLIGPKILLYLPIWLLGVIIPTG